MHDGIELHCGDALEREARAAGHLVVAGLDEVGRGALCGPVVACAVVLGTAATVGLDDSKRLTRLQRERLAERLQGEVSDFAIGCAEVSEIDRLNIRQATFLAMQRAFEALAPSPDFVLVDGHDAPALPAPVRTVVKGDARSVSIAAASILAKVHRDALMRGLEQRFPGYDLACNMGYGSEIHRAALSRLGPCPLHRRSFAGVLQGRLF